MQPPSEVAQGSLVSIVGIYRQVGGELGDLVQ